MEFVWKRISIKYFFSGFINNLKESFYTKNFFATVIISSFWQTDVIIGNGLPTAN